MKALQIRSPGKAEIADLAARMPARLKSGAKILRADAVVDGPGPAGLAAPTPPLSAGSRVPAQGLSSRREALRAARLFPSEDKGGPTP